MQVFCCLEKFFIANNARRELSYTHHFNLNPNNIREVEKVQYRYHNTFHKATCARVTQPSNLGHDIFKNVFAVVSQVAAEGTFSDVNKKTKLVFFKKKLFFCCFFWSQK